MNPGGGEGGNMVNTNISVIAENAVIIECPITGTPQPEIIWYKEGVRLHPENEVSIIFIITTLLKSLEYMYPGPALS